MPKILHFEDDTFLSGMYGTKFKLSGFEYVWYESPTEDPVSIVKKERPDLIIMDIIMPDIDGFQATLLLKADTATKDIPILGLCNLGQKKDIEKALECGMNDYMISARHMPGEVVQKAQSLIGESSNATHEAAPRERQQNAATVASTGSATLQTPRKQGRLFRASALFIIGLVVSVLSFAFTGLISSALAWLGLSILVLGGIRLLTVPKRPAVPLPFTNTKAWRAFKLVYWLGAPAACLGFLTNYASWNWVEPADVSNTAIMDINARLADAQNLADAMNMQTRAIVIVTLFLSPLLITAVFFLIRWAVKYIIGQPKKPTIG